MELFRAKVCIQGAAAQPSQNTKTIHVMLLAEKLVGEARSRRAQRMAPRERIVLAVSAACFLTVAVALALLLPNVRATEPLVVSGLALGYVAVERVRFEFGGYYGTAEQLVVVPIALLVPLPIVPLIIAAANVVSGVPEMVEGTWHRQRLAGRLADCWFCIAPVLILAAFAPGEPSLAHAEIYALALAGQLAGDFAWTYTRDRLLDRLPFRELVSGWFGTARVDAILAPLAFIITLAAVDEPLALLAIAPLAWLLHSFARDREERYAKTLELHRAYRGTVMLLSDVIESENTYTGQHSRSVVDLVNAVAEDLGFPEEGRQELEFAAMLHDVGKIAIPKHILGETGPLTDGELEVMKTHTIEGQFMLDRVGGLLGQVGEIVRSCHERWDGHGYPDRLAGEEIPLASRVVFCCDAYNAMTSERLYRPTLPENEALAELIANAGTQFDPRVVAAVVRVVEAGGPVFARVDELRAMLASAPLTASPEPRSAPL
jgi:HD-GYP domain-containing protein (c-di-GMP phosphodiesterase class II)